MSPPRSASEATRALLLLCAPLGDPAAPVLAAAERRRLENWLRRGGATLPLLAAPGALERLCAAGAPPVPPVRLRALLDRAPLMDAALAAWNRDGLHPVGLFDERYPRRLKRRLALDAPPVLLLRGDPALLNRGGTLLSGTLPPRAVAALLAASRAAEATVLCPAADPFAAHLPADDLLAILVGTAAGGSAPPAGGGTTTLLLPAPPLLPSPAPFLSPLLASLLLADAAVLFPDPDRPPLAELSRALEANWQPIWIHAPDGTRDGTPDGGGESGSDPSLAPLLRLGARTLLPRTLDRADLLHHLRADPAPAPRAAALPSGPRLVSPVPGFAEAAAPFGAPPPPARASFRVIPGGGAEPPSRPARPAATAPADALFELFLALLPPLLRAEPLGLSPMAAILRLDRAQLETWLHRAQARGLVHRDPATRLYSLC